MTPEDCKEIKRSLSEILFNQKELLKETRLKNQKHFVVQNNKEVVKLLGRIAPLMRPGAIIPLSEEEMKLLQKYPIIPIGDCRHDSSRSCTVTFITDQSEKETTT